MWMPQSAQGLQLRNLCALWHLPRLRLRGPPALAPTSAAVAGALEDLDGHFAATGENALVKVAVCRQQVVMVEVCGGEEQLGLRIPRQRREEDRLLLPFLMLDLLVSARLTMADCPAVELLKHRIDAAPAPTRAD